MSPQNKPAKRGWWEFQKFKFSHRNRRTKPTPFDKLIYFFWHMTWEPLRQRMCPICNGVLQMDHHHHDDDVDGDDDADKRRSHDRPPSVTWLVDFGRAVLKLWRFDWWCFRVTCWFLELNNKSRVFAMVCWWFGFFSNGNHYRVWVLVNGWLFLLNSIDFFI